jgi:hypothetical protein
MKKRGFIVILAAIPVWVFVERSFRAFNEARRSPLGGYEIGSAAGSFPLLMWATPMLALLLSLLGLCLVGLDFNRWITRRLM